MTVLGPPARPLAISLLGPFSVTVNGAPLPRLHSRKEEAILSLLTLHHDRCLERAWLVGLLWPDTSHSQGLATLRRYLNDLRHGLGSEGSRLRSPTSSSLVLDLTGATVDLITFESALARGDRESLEEAVSLYRGPLLEGWTEEWVFEERARREQAYLQALEALAADALKRGDLRTAEQHLRRVVAVDPLRETAQRALMQTLAAGGSYAAAIQSYRDLRLLLHRELNARPAPETEALFQQLRAEAREKAAPGAGCFRRLSPGAQHPAPSSGSGATRHNLPASLTRFIGREREMSKVKERLRATRLLTLTGVGGCGKTRLALEVAAQVLAEYTHGVWLVELALLTDPALLPQTVAAVLRAREQPGRSIMEILTDSLRERQALLVLDNCEHLVSACASLADPVLRACPHLRILATSRQPLGIAGEVTWPVPPLSLPPPAHCSTGGDLSQYESVRLFVDRATQALPAFRMTPREASAVAQLCRRLDGLPLALELAAARVRALSVEQIEQRLEDRFNLLTGGSRTALPRHQTLRSLIDWSYDLLTEEERILFRRLSVFAGGWTLEKAEAICSDCGLENAPGTAAAASVRDPQTGGARSVVISKEQLLDLLTHLLEKSMVQREQSEGEAQYRFLETVRQYSRERLLETGELVTIRQRHRDWFLGFAERAERELRGPDQSAWLQRLEEEHDNLRAALEWSRESGEAEAGLRLGGALGDFWWRHGHWSEGRERLTALLAMPGASERTAARAKALQAAGLLAQWQLDLETARALCEESLGIGRELGDRRGTATSLYHLGGVVNLQGDGRLAHELLQQSLQTFHEVDDRWGAANALYALGLLALHTNCAAAQALHEESLALRRRLSDRKGIAASLNILGFLALQRGDFATARTLGEEELAIERELGTPWGIADSLGLLGLVAYYEGDYQAAQPLCEESLAIARELGARGSVAESLQVLGKVFSRQGDLEGAWTLFAESLAIRREAGEKPGIASSLVNLGAVAFHQGRYEVARSHFVESLSLWQEGTEMEVAECLEGAAGLALGTGLPQRAARLLGAADALLAAKGLHRHALDHRAEYERRMAAARAALGEATFAAAWSEGRAMTLEHAVCFVLEEDEIPIPDRKGGLGGMTRLA